MPRRLEFFTTALVAMAVCAAPFLSRPAAAQDLQSAEDIVSLCERSHPPTSPDLALELVSTGSLVDAEALTSETFSVVKRLYTSERSALLLNSFTARIEPAAFQILATDTLIGDVTIPAFEPFDIVDTRYGLQFSSQEMHISCASDVLETLTLAHEAGLLALDVTFELASADEPSEPYCTIDEDAGKMLIHGRLLDSAFVHLGSGERLCSFTTQRARERAVRFSDANGHPKPVRSEVEVTKIEPLAANMDLDVDTESHLRREIEAALMPCYQMAICRNGRRQGALTLRIAFDEAGTLETPTVTVDALDSELITGCAINQLANVRLELDSQIPEVGVVVIFRLLEGNADPNPPGWLPGLRAAGSGAIHGLEGL